MNQLPDGVVTFLFTDIEGSTRLLQQHPDALKAALLRHNALLSGAIETHHGQVFETVGDAYYAVFTHATDAVAAALDAQQTLADERWDERAPIKARIALHTGDVERRDKKYFGAPLFRCARLLSTAHGGQVVLSSTTAELVQESLPTGASLRDLGEHRLRDLTRSERIWQLQHRRLPADFLPLRSLTTRPNNLPAQLTTFIGRDREIGEVRRLLGTTRLLTLAGAGGAGKTRLALQIGTELLHDYPEGVWFVELAPLTDGGLVPQTIARALGQRESASQPMIDVLVSYLRSKKLLLVLDNCEHLVGSCARDAEALLRACSQIQILATSREPLGVAGEVCWRVPSLSVPSPKGTLLLEQLAQFEAVRLFVDRAVAVAPSFAVSNRNAPAVSQICWRLDGIPLAIELAAARVRVLTVEQISARLDDRFKLLTGGSRTALPRQQTLRALIDWSHDLLTENERIVFRRLAAFSGGFSLEAAEVVCGQPPIDSDGVLDLLTQLVEKSLVLTEEAGEETRYRLSESVRQYALDRLTASGELERVRRQHAIYFVELAETVAPLLLTRDRVAWLRRLENEYDNVRAVLVASRAAGEGSLTPAVDLELGLRLVGALCWFWVVRGIPAEGQSWVEALLTRRPGEPTREVASALTGAGILAAFLGQADLARERLAESVTAWRRVGSKAELAQSLIILSAVTGPLEGMPEGSDEGKEGVTLYRASGDTSGLALALRMAGMAAYNVGDQATARAMTEEAVRQFYVVRDLWFVAQGLNSLGDLARGAGDEVRATELYRETLAICREQDLRGMIPSVLQNLGQLALGRGDAGDAVGLFREALTLFYQLGDRRGMAECLGCAAGACSMIGRLEPAGRLFGATEAALAEVGAVMWPANRAAYERRRAEVRERLGEGAFAAVFAEGQAMTLERSVTYAREQLGSISEDRSPPAR